MAAREPMLQDVTPMRDEPGYFCGYATGFFNDESRTNWDGSGPRPISWSVWYPTDAEPTDEDKANDSRRIFMLGDVSEGALLSGDRERWPVVMLSHGTGGTAEGLGWLAYELARHGYIAIAPNHHGNTGVEPFRAEAFICWWERASDLSLLLDHLTAAGLFAGKLDLDRVSAAGFSIGGYTALVLAGARTSVEQFQEWGRDKGALARGTGEFPNVAERLPDLMKTSESFRAAFARQSDDLCDPRIKSVVAIAPAPPVRGFLPESVKAINIPVHLVTSGADEIAPRLECADWLKSVNPAFALTCVGERVGHYTFLGLPTRIGRRMSPQIFADNEGVDRAAVHDRVVDLVLAALA